MLRKGLKGRLEYEQLEKHVKLLAKELNTPEAEYPQPYFQGTSATRRFIQLSTLSQVLYNMAVACGRADFPTDPFAVEQPLLWLDSACIEGHIIPQERWIVQDWMLTPAQRAAYKADDQRKQAEDANSMSDGVQ